MRLVKIIQFGGKEVQVKELTIEELDNLLLQPAKSYVPTWLDRILDKDNLSGSLLMESTGLTESELRVAPSRIRPLVEAFKEVNPDFFETVRLEKERESREVEEIAAGLRRMFVSSSGGPAPSSSSADDTKTLGSTD